MLDSIRVLDLTDERGLVAGHMLAKLGADVIQVEPPSGSTARRVGPFDPRAPRPDSSLYWAAYAAAKRGITCDLDKPEGRDLFLNLVRLADMMVVSGVPGTMERRNLGWDELKSVNRRLIYVSITPFGEHGPKSMYADSDLIVWAAGGPLWPSRDGDRPPLRISSSQSYLHAAADAAVGALVAYIGRQRTGEGQKVLVSAQQSVAQATISTVLAAAVGHPDYSITMEESVRNNKKNVDLSGSGSRTRRSKWIVKDGIVELHLAMGPGHGRFTNNLFSWLRSIGDCDARFAEWDWTHKVPAMIKNNQITDQDMEEARRQVGAALKKYTKNDLLTITMKKQLLIAPVMTIAELANNEQLLERNTFVTVTDGEGHQSRIPGILDGLGRVHTHVRPAPKKGEHNKEIYAEIGITSTQLRNLEQRGIV